MAVWADWREKKNTDWRENCLAGKAKAGNFNAVFIFTAEWNVNISAFIYAYFWFTIYFTVHVASTICFYGTQHCYGPLHPSVLLLLHTLFQIYDYPYRRILRLGFTVLLIFAFDEYLQSHNIYDWQCGIFDSHYFRTSVSKKKKVMNESNYTRVKQQWHYEGILHVRMSSSKTQRKSGLYVLVSEGSLLDYLHLLEDEGEYSKFRLYVLSSEGSLLDYVHTFFFFVLLSPKGVIRCGWMAGYRFPLICHSA